MEVKTKKEFISFLIESNVLKFGNFITKSKRKTPYFINTGNFKTGKQLNILGDFYSKMVFESGVIFDALFGPAYKGISLVICCCSALEKNYKINKPFFFNRKEKKDHGEGGNFIGYSPKEKENVIIIEDVLTAGTAIRETLPMLQSNFNVVCENVFVLVDRCEISKNNNVKTSDNLKKEFNLDVHSLITIENVLEFLKNNKIYEDKIKNMQSYINTYCML